MVTLKEELETLSHEQLLNWALNIAGAEQMLRQVVDECPPCPHHGKGCISYALEWIRQQKQLTPTGE